MKTGKITAKLRDAVPVCLMVNGEEVKRYKNIELPDELKEVEMTDFHFNVPQDGKIAFEIHYEPGVLPEVFPEARTRVRRTAKVTEKVENVAAPEIETTEASIDISTREETALTIIPEAPAVEPAGNEVSESEEPTEKTNADEVNGLMEILYNVTGPRRKELAAAVGDFIGAKPKYMKAPTYAFVVENYTIGRDGTLTGKENNALIEALAAQGFTPAA